MSYKVTTKDTNQSFSLWDTEASLLIALLAKRLSECRGLDANKVTTSLNYKYLRKRLTTPKKNCNATRGQRSIIKEEGY